MNTDQNNKNGNKTVDILGYIVTGLFICIFVLLGVAYYVFASGFVAAKLWGWFLVPIFGFPYLSIMQAWGIIFTIHFFILIPSVKKEFLEPTPTNGIAIMIYPWFVLAIGYLVKIMFL